MTIQTISPERLAYTAGLFDGEGCIAAKMAKEQGRQPRATVNVLLGMTDIRPILRLEEDFGGSFRYIIRKAGNKGVWAWTLGSRASETFLLAILPYLIVKKDEAEAALELLGRIGKTRRHRAGNRGSLPLSGEEADFRAGLVAKIGQLKRRGRS